MSYKQNAAANRDALFGGASGKKKNSSKKSNYKQDASANRDALFSGASSGGGRAAASSTTRPSTSSQSTAEKPKTTSSGSSGYMYGVKTTYGQSKKPTRPALSGEARVAKLKEADEHRKQAKKLMQRGVFSKPDPVAASMYYKRAAEAYMQCGEVRLERIHRIASADCQARQGAYATAAADYVRAAELVEESNEMSLEEQRNEASRLYLQAAENFTQMNEPAKAGKYRIKAAMAWTYGDDSGVLDKRTMVALEEAIEGYCPDLLNRHARYRQTGTSAFVNPEHPEPTPEDLQMAKHHLVTSSYAHEPVMELVYVFIENREYPSALYAAGAASAILEKDGISTLTLGRTFVVETILLLAMGDPVGAEQLFLNTHVQQTSYLSSRECRLAEDLFRAVLQRDGDALEETRSPHGPNRAALANLHPKARELVMQLRISGVAKKTSSTKKKTAPVAPIPQQEEEDDEFVSSNPETEAPPPSAAQQTDIDELHAEMDDLLNDMGLGSDTESEGEEDSDDDELDLR